MELLRRSPPGSGGGKGGGGAGEAAALLVSKLYRLKLEHLIEVGPPGAN